MPTHDRFQEDDEPELDPAAERVRRKLARLLFGSLSVMLLGLLAVFGAILYRVSFAGGNAAEPARQAEAFPPETTTGRIALPAGAEVLSTALDGDRALLHVRSARGVGLWLVDLRSGRVLSRLDVAAE